MKPDERTRMARALTVAGERLQHAGDALVELGTIFAELGQPAPTPAAPPGPKLAAPPASEPDEPPDVQRSTSPSQCPLKRGGALYAWAKDHGLVQRVNDLGTAWGYPERMVDWDAAQVASVYHEVIAKAPAGSYPVKVGAPHQRKGVGR